MADQVQFVENVVLIDLAGFNEAVSLIKRFFEDHLNREVDDLDLQGWVSCMAMDAGIATGKNRIQVIFLHDGTVNDFACCNAPSPEALKGAGFNNSLGDFTFSVISSEGFASQENFFLDLMNIALDSAEVKRLILIPDNGAYGDKMHEALHKTLPEIQSGKPKDIVCFFTAGQDQPQEYKCDSLIFSMMHCMNINSEELGFIYEN